MQYLKIKKLESIWNNTCQFNYWLLSLFFSLGLLGILRHAMWRDELNGWLISRDSSFPGEFLQNIRYEGHPVLWYICLYYLNQLTANPGAMQLLHLLIATASIYLFLHFSPFNKVQKSLFCFGYLPFYEYLLISRNYAIGLLSIFAFCTLFEGRKKGYIYLAIALAFMANSNAYCLCISVAFCLTLVLEYAFKHWLEIPLNASLKNRLTSLSIYALGLLASVTMLIPPRDSTLQGGASQWMWQFDSVQLTRTLSRIWNSYILLILPSDGKPIDLWIFAIISLGLFIFAVTIFIKKPVVLLFYLIASWEILLFTYVKFLGSPRHYGHLYIILIACFWLSCYYKPSDLLTQSLLRLPPKLQKISSQWLTFVARQQMTFITIILAAQFAAGIFSYIRDLTIPYSASRETASYIQAHQLEGTLMVGSEDFAVSPIAAYLQGKIYYPESDRLGSFVLFTAQREELDSRAILEKISQINKKKKQDILLILNHELDASRGDLKISFLDKFTRAFIHNEKYYLYLVSPAGHPLTINNEP